MKKKKQPLVFKPHARGKILDCNTFKRALVVFVMGLVVCFLHLLIATALNFNSVFLRVLLNAGLIAGTLYVFFNTGAREGFEDVNAGEITQLHLDKGREVDPKTLDRGFHPAKGFVIGLLGIGLYLILALIHAFTAQKQGYSLQSLPAWVNAYMGEDSIGAPLAYYSISAPFVFTDLLRILLRIVIMPYVNIIGTHSPDALLTVDRLSPLFVLLPALCYGIGYLQGPVQRAQIHGDIQRNIRRKRKKARQKATRQGRNEPKQLV